MRPYHASFLMILIGCGDAAVGPGSDAGADADAGPIADCCADAGIPPANASCLSATCVSGVCAIEPAKKGTICGGDAAEVMHGECTGDGVCSWTAYGADPCGGVPDQSPCRNGQGNCFNGVCVQWYSPDYDAGKP